MWSVESIKGQQLHADTTTNFLPKFDNQSDNKRLAQVVGEKGVLYVSKKHSGSLVMAPPFYSKNGTGNEFSRMGGYLLYEFFKAVWPQNGKEKFVEWWKDAESRNICYSFECVAPRVLGDHGATPSSAYMVLTCVSLTDQERFMSPSELLEIATRWRLPLNEVWFVDGRFADQVESALHKERWTMQDEDASAILDQFVEGEHQCFLSHSETQGQVLEGFVLMALDADSKEMAKLVENYNETMKPFKTAALARTEEIGKQCLDPEQGKKLLAGLRDKTIEPLNLPEVFQEPEKLKKDFSQAHLVDIISKHLAPSRVQKLLLRLTNTYGHVSSLIPYSYKGDLQLHLHIRDDEVFYGWPLHTQDSSTGMLFRGMVVTLKQGQGALELPSVPSDVRILGISKLKCLNYMWRTFAVRNRVGILMKRGKADYLKTIKQGFYKPWGIPKEYCDRLDVFFSRWADFALTLNKSEKESLSKGYLEFVERFLEQTPFPMTASSDQLMNTSTLISVYVVHFDPFLELQASSLGLDLKTGLMSESNGFRGTFRYADKFPNAGSLQAVDVVLVCPPVNLKSGKYNAFVKKTLPRLTEVFPDTLFVMDPSSKLDWEQKLLKHQANLNQQTDVSHLPKRVVICAAGLPPGGGKSSLFAELKSYGKSRSDFPFEFKSSDDFKGRDAFEKKFIACFEGGNDDIRYIGYDKNIPNSDGMKRLMGVLAPLRQRFNMHILVVVPETLDHDVLWNRVKQRDPKTHIGLAIGPKLDAGKAYNIFKTMFFDPCAEYLEYVSIAPGAVITNAFLSTGGVSMLRTALSETFQGPFENTGASFDELCCWVDKFEDQSFNKPVAPDRGNWCCADITGKLHVTLVPPPVNRDEAKNPGRQSAMKSLGAIAGREVTIRARKYHVAEAVVEASQGKRARFGSDILDSRSVKRIAFWEVESIEGLPDNIDLGDQFKILHITDRASMTNGVKAKSAGDLMKQLKEKKVESEWQVVTEDHPVEISGIISFYQ